MSDDPFANPWVTKGTRLVYRNPWITVREDQVVRPDGKDGIYGVVEAKVATAVVALTAAREVVLVGQWRYATGTYSWELVEGGAERGEDPLAAARRELREEAGLEAAVWTPLGGEVHLTNSHSDERLLVWLATGLREVGAAPEGTELLQHRRVPFAEALRMVDRGEITDAPTIIGLLRAERMMRSS